MVFDKQSETAEAFETQTCLRKSFDAVLDRLGGCTPQLDCGADRKSVVSERCCIAGGQPFESAPITLTDAEREAIAYYLGTGGPYAVYKTLSGLLSRTGTDGEKACDDAAKCTDKE